MIASLLLGILAGIITGILPGLGLTSTLILTYAFLKELDPFNLLIFYGSLICSVQYFGSVVGIYLGIPGEINSLIASKTGFKFMHKGQGAAALGSTAIASLFAASAGIACFYLLAESSEILLPLLSVKVQSAILVSILILMLLYSDNRFHTNALLIIIGISISTIGYNSGGISTTFGLEVLNPGLNSALVLTALYVVPNLLRYRDQARNQDTVDLSLDFKRNIGWIIKKSPAMIRGTLIGCFSGLIPGVGPVICSNLSARFERNYKKHGYSNELIAAESSNNSAILISIIPFVSLGLVILPHEAVIYDVLINNGTILNIKWMQEGSRLETLAGLLILANIACFLIAWPASKILVAIYQKINYKVLIVLVLSLVFSMIFYQSYLNYRIDLDSVSLLLMLPLSYLFISKKIDSLPLIFSFMIGDQTVKSLIFLKNIL